MHCSVSLVGGYDGTPLISTVKVLAGLSCFDPVWSGKSSEVVGSSTPGIRCSKAQVCTWGSQHGYPVTVCETGGCCG